MTTADYADLVHTGPGTLAGRYLRSFWQPVYRGEDLASGRIVPIRIMGEEFTLYRGEGGMPHVMAYRCAHRGAQLSAGWVEEDCIRCFYHGWKYDGSGQCVEQPGEDESFAAKITIRSYPTEEYLGLTFAYLGEGAAPPLPRYPSLEGPGVLEVYQSEYWPCNYFNRIDNGCDAAHVAFAHRESRQVVKEHNKLPELAAEETDYGVKTSVMRDGKVMTTLHFLMPNTNHFQISLSLRDRSSKSTAASLERFLWRVPIDDGNCVSFPIDFAHLTGEEAEEYRERRRQARLATPTPHTELGEAVLAGKLRVDEIEGQANLKNLTSVEDYVAQVGQGAIADRANEHLGRMDVGVILLRKLWQRELQALSDGRPLKRWSTVEQLAAMGVA